MPDEAVILNIQILKMLKNNVTHFRDTSFWKFPWCDNQDFLDIKVYN